MPFSKTKEDLLQFLDSHYVAVLSTVKEGNLPHASTIYFYADKECNFYFLTRDMTKKFYNIRYNGHVSLVISDKDTLESVQIEGIAVEVNYSQEYASQVKELTEKLKRNGYSWEQIPLNHITDGYYVFIKITPHSIKWLDYKDWGQTLQYEQVFSE